MASTIGTIMALLIFLTLISVFVNTYIPIWMKENERNHMNDVMNQFGDMKGKIDNMMVYASMTGKPTLPSYQNIQLGSQGIPAFASPTAGFLFIEPKGSNVSSIKTAFHELGSANTMISMTGGGRVEVYAPNRYYVQQWIAYENGGIIIRQEDGQVVRAEPGIIMSKDSSSAADLINMVITQVDIISGNSSYGGTGSVGLNLNLIYVDSQTFSVSTTTPSIDITLVSKFGPSYYNYLNQSLAALNLDKLSSTFTKTVTTMTYHQQMTATTSFEVKLINLYYNAYQIELHIVNPTTKSATIDYHQAYVNVEVTE